MSAQDLALMEMSAQDLALMETSAQDLAVINSNQFLVLLALCCTKLPFFPPNFKDCDQKFYKYC